MKNATKRREELDALKGGTVSNAKRTGNVFTARVAFKTSLEAQAAAAILNRKGWGASLDGKVVRCLVVVG